MEPLDLHMRPPRPPQDEIDGLLFLARTIDKARASLPGGALGDYKIAGFSQQMFDALGVAGEAFIEVVRAASSDAAVASWMRKHAATERYEEWNAFVRGRPLVGTGDRDEAIRRYPWLSERPDIERQIDVLVEDDRRAFITTTTGSSVGLE